MNEIPILRSTLADTVVAGLLMTNMGSNDARAETEWIMYEKPENPDIGDEK